MWLMAVLSVDSQRHETLRVTFTKLFTPCFCAQSMSFIKLVQNPVSAVCLSYCVSSEMQGGLLK